MNAVLSLSTSSVNFEPVNKLSDVFYDNVNKKVSNQIVFSFHETVKFFITGFHS